MEGMIRQRTFVKKTKRGKVRTIVREHYLRDDIWCGSTVCEECHHEGTATLEQFPEIQSNLFEYLHYIIPDTNVVLHQIDVLEHALIKNVILLQTVLDEVKHRSAPVYKRIKDAAGTSEKHFYTFVNEFHKDTYIERDPGETANDRNDRAIRTAAMWYQLHLVAFGGNSSPKVVLLTDDAGNKKKAEEMGIPTFTIHEYVKSLKGSEDLIDKLTMDNKSFGDNMPVFPAHLPLSEIQRGLKAGKYIQGSFQASRENYLEGTVMIADEEENTIFLQGHHCLNRAVQGDIVAVEVLPEEEWTCPSSMIMEETEATEEKPDEDTTKEDAELKRSKGPKIRSGKIVGIIKRNWRQYCGILQKSQVKNATRHLFKAAERRIPKIRIETRQASALEGCRIIVAIDTWPRNSRYPLGHFVRNLGSVGDKDTENEVLLLEHDVPHNTWSEAVLACLPSLPWIITEEDEKRRVDLRSVPICSVDPPGCTDIDDALHAVELPNGNFEVGVHIADVSHFIRPGTALDREAASRATTVYLIDKRIDMVPELLSSNLCSLRGNEERFAFSVIWEMNDKAEIVNVKYHKSIILSKAAMTYAEAQMKIDDPTMNDDVTKGLRRLNMLAKILKRKRIDNGALTLASNEVRFHIDSETHDPIDVVSKKILDTNSMVEEFMLLANISVAEKTLAEFPDCALLRRHPSPPASNYDPIIKVATSKGFKMNVNTGKGLAESLENAVIPENPYFNTMLRILCTRCMMQALYFCSGMCPPEEYCHYGLACPIYTHFTSPIRRYSDIIVHRLLAVAIGADASYPSLLDKKKSQNICYNLNYRHKMAQYAGRASVALHTQLFFKNRVLDEPAYVLFVRKNALQILIPKFGLEGTIYLHDEKDRKKSIFTYDEEASTQSTGDVVFHVFDPVTVQISIDSSNIQHQKLQLKLVKPEIPNFSVPPTTNSSKEDSQPPPKKVKT